jgi:hypothetical protein
MTQTQTQKAPASEFSEEFVQMMAQFPGKMPPEFINGMRTRMAMSYFKYGAVADAYPDKVNAIESGQMRIEKYINTGNIEFLIDAGNFWMIETMCPRRDSTFTASIGFVPGDRDALENIQECIQEYLQTGNKTYLARAARFTMDEFTNPQHSSAYFKATDSIESPGRATNDGAITQRSNDEV